MKNNIRNKARVEGSIANAYLIEEISTFSSFYFEYHVPTKLKAFARNEVADECDEDVISVFRQVGQPFGKSKSRFLDDQEYKAATIYLLLNCAEIEQYIT